MMSTGNSTQPNVSHQTTPPGRPRARASASPRAFASAAAALLLGGCIHFGTAIVATREAPFRKNHYHAFAFLPEAPPAPAPKSKLTSAVRDAVQSELEAKGYTATPKEKADLLVTYYVNLGAGLDSASLGYSDTAWRNAHTAPDPVVTPPDVLADAPWEIGHFHDPQSYLGVAVMVDAIDAHTNALAWRGWARRKEVPEEINAGEIAKVVRAVLETFPPNSPAGK